MDTRDLEAELSNLRTSLRTPQKAHMSALGTALSWLKDAEHAIPKDVHDDVGKWRDRAKEALSDHPILAAAVALCLGVAIGQMWRRRHD